MQSGDVGNRCFVGFADMTMGLYVVMQEIALSVCVCGDGWFDLLHIDCSTGVQPHSPPESNQSDWGQLTLLKPAVICTHSTPYRDTLV